MNRYSQIGDLKKRLSTIQENSQGKIYELKPYRKVLYQVASEIPSHLRRKVQPSSPPVSPSRPN